MERRVLLAIFLCFLVLYLWNALMVKPVPQPAVPTATKSLSAPSTGASTAEPSLTKPAEAAPDLSRPIGAPVVAESSERDIRVETADVLAVFTNRGARLKSWRLKHYLDQNKAPQELVVGPIDSQPLPFTLRVADERTNATMTNGLYAVSQTAPSSTAPTHLRFEYATAASALRVVKEIDVAAEGYVVTFSAMVTTSTGDGDTTGQAVPYSVAWGPAVGDLGEVSSYSQKAGALLLAKGNNKAQRVASKDLTQQPNYDGEFRYVGVEDNYFLTVALSPGPVKVRYQPVSIPPPPDTKQTPRELVAYSIEPALASPPIQFFVGPKDFAVLERVGKDMTSAIYFGYFEIIVVPLLQSLKWLHGYVGNYGWSIVLLTVVINAIMFPLRHKSAVSMRKMQAIQPEVKAIQDRYSKLKTTDPARQKMNQELMGLYKERGVNPASGCVPTLLTMPVFLAMWALLQISIELRGAPWFGWIHDLSSHDRYYVLPIVMVASQFWQQRLMPTAGADPAQQRMMMIMPAVMGFIFLWLPAGALIYYVISNLWMIGQQYVTNWLIGPPVTRTVRPAAERRMKRVGGGKTDAVERAERDS